MHFPRLVYLARNYSHIHLMSFPVILIRNPLDRDYEALIAAVFGRISSDVSGIDVVVDSPIENTGELNDILLHLYPQLRRIATENGFSYNFEIDVLVNKLVALDDRTVFCLLEECVDNHNFECISVEVTTRKKQNNFDRGIGYKQVETTAVGGTFDHIHDGHKILLLMTAFAARKMVIVGVTGPKLLVNKKFADVMEPLETRILRVCTFLQKVASPGIAFNIYQINDICGPTGFVRAIDALIISQETVKGGEFVNNYRQERNFPAIQIVVVKVIGGDGSGNETNNWKGKLSSTDIREAEHKRLHASEGK